MKLLTEAESNPAFVVFEKLVLRGLLFWICR